MMKRFPGVASESPNKTKRHYLIQKPGLNMDCLEVILSFLNYNELVQVSSVCKMWKYVADYVMPKLTRLEFDWCKSTPRTCAHFLAILQRTDLSFLDLSNLNSYSKEIEGEGEQLLEAIKVHCPNLTTFYSFGFPLEKKSALYFFSEMPNLTHLDLRSCNLKEAVLKQILSKCRALKFLDVASNKISGECFTILSEPNNELKYLGIASNPKLKELYSEDSEIAELLDHINRLCPELEMLDISRMCFDPFFDQIFLSDDIGFMEIDKPFEMNSLKRLSVRNFGGYSKSIPEYNALYERNDQLFPRLPSLEILDLTENALCASFFIKLAELCPKLKSLNLSWCQFNFEDSTDLNSSGFNDIFSALKGLNTLHVDNLMEVKRIREVKDIEDEYDLFGVANLQFLIEGISSNMKELKLLNISHYTELTNEQVVQLIISLPKLERLYVQQCPKVNDDLLLLLTAHPELGRRSQQLVLGVGLTEITKDAVAPGVLKLDLLYDDLDYYDLADNWYVDDFR